MREAVLHGVLVSALSFCGANRKNDSSCVLIVLRGAKKSNKQSIQLIQETLRLQMSIKGTGGTHKSTNGHLLSYFIITKGHTIKVLW